MFLYVHHVHYVVKNCEEMAGYMERNFGMKPEFIGINSNGKEARYKVDKTQIQIVEPLPGSKQERFLAEHGPGVYHVAWAVKDAEQACKDLEQAGNKILPGKGKTRDNDPVCNIDPQSSLGVRFDLVTG